MSNHVHGFYEHHLPQWEATGVETAEGDRDFNAGEEPTSAEFDYFFDQVFKAIDGLCEVIHDYILPQRFTPEALQLVGEDAGSYDALTAADDHRIPVIILAAGAYQQLSLHAVIVKDQTLSTPEETKVRIVWSTAAAISRTAEWIVYYKSVAAGESATAGSFSSVSESASDSAVSHGLVVTEVELPVLTRGEIVFLEIGHRGDIDDIINDVCVHRIEVI